MVFVVVGEDDLPHRFPGDGAERGIGQRHPLARLRVHQQQLHPTLDDEDVAVGEPGDDMDAGGDGSDRHSHDVGLCGELRGPGEHQCHQGGSADPPLHGLGASVSFATQNPLLISDT
jgi:hypothetical protein